jgi:hypothetical protein
MIHIKDREYETNQDEMKNFLEKLNLFDKIGLTVYCPALTQG